MIRRIEAADAEPVAALAREARLKAIPGFQDLHTPAQDVVFYRGEITSKSGCVEVDESAAIAGFVIWQGEFIDHLYVHPARQRSGIGTRLLNRAVAQIAAPEVRLWTFQSNAPAVAFYLKHGFRILLATDGAANDERLPDYLLVRP